MPFLSGDPASQLKSLYCAACLHSRSKIPCTLPDILTHPTRRPKYRARWSLHSRCRRVTPAAVEGRTRLPGQSGRKGDPGFSNLRRPPAERLSLRGALASDFRSQIAEIHRSPPTRLVWSVTSGSPQAVIEPSNNRGHRALARPFHAHQDRPNL